MIVYCISVKITNCYWLCLNRQIGLISNYIGIGFFFLWARSKSFSSRFGISGRFFESHNIFIPGMVNSQTWDGIFGEKRTKKSHHISYMAIFSHWPLDEAASYKSHAFWWSSQVKKKRRWFYVVFDRPIKSRFQGELIRRNYFKPDLIY